MKYTSILVILSLSCTLVNAKFDWSHYYRLESIYTWMKELSEIFPEVSILNIGNSYEGRDIKGVKISFKEGNKAVFLEGGIHAREWISPATVTWILNELLISEDPNVREIAEYYDWYIFPVVNPDGYEYSHTANRNWRKTRRPVSTFCSGTDLNRNWGHHWMEGGSNILPCSEIYAGPFPFSEPETIALSNFITRVHESLVAYIGFHSFAQKLLIPYGHTNANLDNHKELVEIGQKAIESLRQRYNTNYEVGNIANAVSVTSGSSMDWVKGSFKTPITYTFELRDTGEHGFVLPPELIVPTAEETFDALVTIMKEAKSRGY